MSVASVNSFSDYGQFAISQSGLGLIMFSAATAHSTMDSSKLPVEDGVVNSPPNNRKHPSIVHSPSPMKRHPPLVSASNEGFVSLMTPRKLYADGMGAFVGPLDGEGTRSDPPNLALPCPSLGERPLPPQINQHPLPRCARKKGKRPAEETRSESTGRSWDASEERLLKTQRRRNATKLVYERKAGVWTVERGLASGERKD